MRDTHPLSDPLGFARGGEGAITGTVVCAAAIAASAGVVHTTGQLVLTILGTVLVYWIAHVHAITIGSAMNRKHHPLAAFRAAFVEALPIVGASVVPLVVLLVMRLFGASLRTGGWAALYATIVLLAVYSYQAGARGGLATRGRLASALVGALVGVLVVALKLLLQH
ncbi:hypothetical protein [Nocardioides conyzicola]|uniref:MAPEG family protein n=1 Tax=Nocardioides conyzicola TaxID=1651781 RepID=A0ABP8WTA4_9ACTN